MAIPAETFTIQPNAVDGIQRLSDPTGGYTPPVEIDPPTNLTVTSNGYDRQEIAWNYNSSGHDGFAVERWISGVDSGWTAQATLGTSARNWESTGLPSNTAVRHRVRATEAAGNHSTWVEVERTTERPPVSGGTDWDRIAHYNDFRNVPIGAKVENHSPISYDGGGHSVGSTGQYMPGFDRSCETYCALGQAGYGYWGFNVNLPTSLQLLNGRDSEFWYRVQVWYPPGMRFTSSGGKDATKFIRLHRWQGSTNRNHIDMYFLPSSSSSSRIQPTVITENPNGSSWDDVPGYVNKGEWVTVEMYGRFHHVPVDQGGTAEMRVWINGQPTGRWTHLYVAGVADTHEITVMRYHTYWNGGSVDDKKHYIQSISYAIKGPTRNGGYRDDTAHMSRDSTGFPFIGMGNKS